MKKSFKHMYLAAVTLRAGLKSWKVINLMAIAAGQRWKFELNCKCLEKGSDSKSRGSCGSYRNTFAAWCLCWSHHYEMRFWVLLQHQQNVFCGLCYTHFPLFLHVDCSEVSVCVWSLPRKKKDVQRMKQRQGGRQSPHPVGLNHIIWMQSSLHCSWEQLRRY